MDILIMGATGFIGTNLSLEIAKSDNKLLLLGRKINKEYCDLFVNKSNVQFLEKNFCKETDFDALTKNIDVVYHFISSSIPASDRVFNNNDDIESTILLLESMVRNKCNKIIFISSGGAIYGNSKKLPFSENDSTNPISEYGIQKLLIEKYLYYYKFHYGIDYKVIRLSNPYGQFQRANKGQGLIATAIYNALNDKEVIVYGDGKNTRDYIFIDDAINSIIKISTNDTKYDLYNVGSGIGYSINDILDIIKSELKINIKIKYLDKRKTDVIANFLDINRYKREFGEPITIGIKEGIRKTIEYWRKKNVGE